MTLTQWTGEMTKMQHLYGAPIDDQQVKLLGVYLAATYGNAATVSEADRAMTAAPAAAAAPAGSELASSGVINVQALLNANACLGCHAIAQKVVGPAYHDVALKYKADPAAVTKLEASIKAGGSGKWGPVPMPPFAQLTDAQLKALAEFVMKQ
jgi:cytochrome c551/c552